MSTFVYVTYIETTPEKLWEALTVGNITEHYFFGTLVESDWQEGSAVAYYRNNEMTDYGNVLKCEHPKSLSFTWTYKDDTSHRESPTRVSFALQPTGSTVKLTLRHENLLDTDLVEDKGTFEGFNNGWPAILSNLKSFLETGKTLDSVSV